MIEAWNGDREESDRRKYDWGNEGDMKKWLVLQQNQTAHIEVIPMDYANTAMEWDASRKLMLDVANTLKTFSD